MNRKVDVQRRNGFALPFINAGTAKVGTLTPVLCKRVVPGDIVTDNISFNIELPPMASNFKGRVDICFESLFVPNRILYGGWRNYYLYNNGPAGQFAPAGVPKTRYPIYRLLQTNSNVGTLMDYLGLPTSPSAVQNVDCLRIMAYHKIWDDWYRNKQVQNTLFVPRITGSPLTAANLPYSSITGNDSAYVNGASGQDSFAFNDGSGFQTLRQRNWSNDYFTDSYLTQNGGTPTFNVSISANDDFSIQSFRTANALTRFAERNQLADGDYKTTTFVNYGVTPGDALCEQSVFIRQLRKPLVTKSVFSTTNTGSNSSVDSPLTDVVGGRAGFTDSVDSGVMFDNFKVKEHGFIMVLMSLVPYANYSQNIQRETTMYVSSDSNAPFSDNFMIPMLSQIGNQPIYKKEIFGPTSDPAGVFSYTERYAEYKNFLNEIHGGLRSDGDLSFYVLQRVFASQPTLSSSFLQIPTTAMDNVTAVASWLSKYGYIYEVFHDCKMVRPLPEYSTPTLCDHILDSKWVSVHSQELN